MKQLLYSPDYTEKLKNLRKYLYNQFGFEIGKQIIKDIGKQVRALRDNEKMGYSVRDMFGIKTIIESDDY